MYGGGGYYSNQRVGYGEPLSESQGGNNNNYHRGGGGGGYQRKQYMKK